MPSAWIIRREGQTGIRYRVLYRIGGHEVTPTYGGSFKTKREARIRRDWIAGELAAMRFPDLRLVADMPKLPTLGEAEKRWRESRIDVVGQTQNMHRSAFVRVFKTAPHLRSRRLDALTVDDMTALVAAFVEAGYKRETIRKTRRRWPRCSTSTRSHRTRPETSG